MNSLRYNAYKYLMITYYIAAKHARNKQIVNENGLYGRRSTCDI